MSRQAAPSIDQLQQLPLPVPPFSYFPQTWGWAVLLLVVLSLAVFWGGLRWRAWQRNRYRREALTHLAELQQALHDPVQRLLGLRELPALLKRVALSSGNASAVAALSGAQWQAFLTRHSQQPLPENFAARLFTLAYAPDTEVQGIAEEEINALFALSRHWIEAHHVAV